nr:DUF58 domain-containing protein [Solimonas marina]
MIAPELLAALAPLRLRSRYAPAGLGTGFHASPHRGSGLEFAEYRAYQPGDEPRRVDWKLYARSDRFFVRDAERDAQLHVWVIVDCSASMGQADAAAPQRTRLAQAAALAACVFELATRQNDRFGLIAIGNDRVAMHGDGEGRRHRDRLGLALDALQAGGAWPDAAALAPLPARIAPGALVLMIGDGFEPAMDGLAMRLAGTRRDVSFVTLLTAEERDFPFDGSPRFEDPEGAGVRRAVAERVRTGFLARFGAARAERQRELTRAGIGAVDAYTDASLIVPLRRLFGGVPGA